MKITLATVGDLTNPPTAQTTINNNFDTIETAFDNTLSRDGTAPNQMLTNLDMNSQQIINLPPPATANSPARLTDVQTLSGGGTISLLPVGGTTGQALKKNSSTNYDVSWQNNVSSVGLALPSDFNVSGSPVTGTGTLTAAWANTPTGSGSVVRQVTPTITTPTLTSPNMSTIVNTGTLTLPTTTDTLVGRATVDTLTQKTFDTAGSGNIFRVNGTQISAKTGTGSVVLDTGATLTSPSIISATVTSSTINGATVSPGHYSGEPSNGAPLSGEIGEVITSNVGGSPISITTGTNTDITSIALTAGDWDVWGSVNFIAAGTTTISGFQVWVNTASATLAAVPNYTSLQHTFTTGSTNVIPAPQRRILVSGATTMYLSVNAAFATSTMTAGGVIFARRRR